MQDSLIGKQVATLNGNTITIKNEKEVNGEIIYVDTDGNIYTEDELDIRYVVSPWYLLYEALRDNHLLKRNVWCADKYEKAFNELMGALVKAGYVTKDKN